MDITLVNPPEKLRVWAGIPKAHAHGVYCFPPLGLMYIQAAIEKRSQYKAEICDPVVDDLDYPDFEEGRPLSFSLCSTLCRRCWPLSSSFPTLKSL